MLVDTSPASRSAHFALSYMCAAAIHSASAFGGAAMGSEIMSFRHRHDGWTPARQVAFLHALRETGCVRSA